MENALRLETRDDGVAVITINCKDASQNVLRPPLHDELASILDRLEDAKGIVIASGKPGSFIAGADIEMLQRVESADEAAEMSRGLQALLLRVEQLPIPVVAAIDGVCLGGGLELALACHARVASTSAKTKLGLPEIQLGLIPGGGGTQRLPALVGVEVALDLMLTGRSVDARKALKLGLVDETVASALVVEAAAARAKAGKKKPAAWSALTDPKALQAFALGGNALGRSLVFRQAEKAAEAKARGHYPAIPKLLEVVRTGLEAGPKRGYAVEAEAFGTLTQTDVARRLIEIFFAQRALEKDRGVDSDTQPASLERVGVLGAGLMGHGIAYVTIDRAGVPVVITDRDETALGAGMKAVHSLVDARVERRRLKPYEAKRTMLRLSGSTRDDAFSNCDVVVEAAFEDLDLKHQLLRKVEAATPPTTIFASNTSSIPIARIAEVSSRKDRVIGMHYFSPVPKMPLLEIIRAPDTSDETVATCVALGKKQGKTVIVVNDGVGFYTSRILGPYLNEAAWMLTEGVPVEVIDRAAIDLGFPVGPIALLDEVGIDVAAKVAKIAESAFGGRLQPPGSLERLVQDGRTGRKTKKGFYLYASGKKKEVDASVYEVLGVEPNARLRPEMSVLQDRLMVMMVQEAIRCLAEGIVRSARDADIGAVFGLGFPPYLGGPLRWADAVGHGELLRRMRGLEDRFGSRFSPPAQLEGTARSGDRFHP